MCEDSGGMKRTTIVIIGITTLLLGSNAAWAYLLLDAAVGRTYLQAAYDEARSTAVQALGLLPEVARAAGREEVITAARRLAPEAEPFEQDGFVWIGQLGVRFDGAGRLVEARAAVEPF